MEPTDQLDTPNRRLPEGRVRRSSKRKSASRTSSIFLVDPSPSFTSPIRRLGSSWLPKPVAIRRSVLVAVVDVAANAGYASGRSCRCFSRSSGVSEHWCVRARRSRLKYSPYATNWRCCTSPDRGECDSRRRTSGSGVCFLTNTPLRRRAECVADRGRGVGWRRSSSGARCCRWMRSSSGARSAC
jgi:hypothetical protein